MKAKWKQLLYYSSLCAIVLVGGVIALRHDARAIENHLRTRDAELLMLAKQQERIWSKREHVSHIVIPGHYKVVPDIHPDGTPVYWKERRSCDLQPGGTVSPVLEYERPEELRLYQYHGPFRIGGCPNNIQFRLHQDVVVRWIAGWEHILSHHKK